MNVSQVTEQELDKPRPAQPIRWHLSSRNHDPPNSNLLANLSIQATFTIMDSLPGRITVSASRTRRHLQSVCREASKRANEKLPDGVDLVYLREECLDRFNIWASSLGVFQKGDASVDQRISSGYMAEEFVRLLDQLDGFVLEREYWQMLV
jgi:hypothetical protein